MDVWNIRGAPKKIPNLRGAKMAEKGELLVNLAIDTSED